MKLRFKLDIVFVANQLTSNYSATTREARELIFCQNKIKSEIWAISFVFWAQKRPLQRRHFQWVLRVDLYVFGISGTRGMRIANNGTLKEQMEIFRQKHEKRRNIEKTKLYSMWSFSRSAASNGGNGLINKTDTGQKLRSWC